MHHAEFLIEHLVLVVHAPILAPLRTDCPATASECDWAGRSAVHSANDKQPQNGRRGGREGMMEGGRGSRPDYKEEEG